MGPDQAINFASEALTVTLTLALPLLVVGLVVGVLISIVQAVTQIQEQTLSFVPKLLAMAAVLVIGGPWMVDIMTQYTRDLWTSIPEMVRK
ncbi:MAG: flagellar biosynthesis protein FliQ [Solirubrobacteraceae bacterium]|nr:flagellar biosynthesis protein FliQ [Solirubrobacteraceae bacterium]